MPQATTNYFDSNQLLDLLGILPEKVKEERLSDNYINQLKSLLELLQNHENAISAHHKRFSDRGYPLPVSDSQKKLIKVLR